MATEFSTPDWLPEYLEHSEILTNLVARLKQGKTDEEIAKQFGVSEERIYNERCRWHLFRCGECPTCGCKEYKDNKCPSSRCLTNWILPTFTDKKRK